MTTQKAVEMTTAQTTTQTGATQAGATQAGATQPSRPGMTLWRDIRTTRPIWGGALLILAGLEILWVSTGGVGVTLTGSTGSLPVLLSGGLVLFGLLAWVTPMYAPMIGLLGQVLALVAFIGANLGGYLVGSILGILGGALVFAWRSRSPQETLSEVQA